MGRPSNEPAVAATDGSPRWDSKAGPAGAHAGAPVGQRTGDVQRGVLGGSELHGSEPFRTARCTAGARRRGTWRTGHRQVLRPRTRVALSQDGSAATAILDDGSRLRARYIVGADGMHSTVREAAGIAFSGGSYGESFVLADVHLTGAVPMDEVILYFSAAGMVVVAPLPGGVHRIVATVADAPEKPSAAYVQALLDARDPQRQRAIVQQVLWGGAQPHVAVAA